MKHKEVIDFIKMSGAGNNFVLIDCRKTNYSFNRETIVPRLCNRRYGIGADGVLFIEPSTRAHFKMTYYNADGSESSMCGNGGRCAALYVMDQEQLDEITFEATDYIYSSRKSNLNINLSMKNPSGLKTNTTLKIYDESINIHQIDTGVPHVVIMQEELGEQIKNSIYESGINEIGKVIRDHELFAPFGTNVNFVTIQDQHTISIRTYERGVENETLACGTGAVASAIITSLVKDVEPPIMVNTRGGEYLRVSFFKNGNQFNEIILEGSAQIIFRGQYFLS